MKPNKKNSEITAYSPEEEYILQASKEYGAEIHLMLALVAKAGLRNGELCGLMWSDIDFEKKKVTIIRSIKQGFSTPNGNCGTVVQNALFKRTILLPECVIEALEQWKAVLGLSLDEEKRNSPYVFSNSRGEALSPPQLSTRIKLFCRRYGFDSKDCSLVRLRKTCAFEMMGNGIPYDVVKEVLGYKSSNFLYY